MRLVNGPAGPEVGMQAKHRKNADVGEKKVVYASSILVEQADAITFEDQEEVSSIPSPLEKHFAD